MGRSKTQKFSLAFCSKESGSLPTMDLDSHDSAESVGIQPTLEASAAQRLARGQGANLSAASYLHNFQKFSAPRHSEESGAITVRPAGSFRKALAREPAAEWKHQ